MSLESKFSRITFWPMRAGGSYDQTNFFIAEATSFCKSYVAIPPCTLAGVKSTTHSLTHQEGVTHKNWDHQQLIYFLGVGGAGICDGVVDLPEIFHSYSCSLLAFLTADTASFLSCSCQWHMSCALACSSLRCRHLFVSFLNQHDHSTKKNTKWTQMITQK